MSQTGSHILQGNDQIEDPKGARVSATYDFRIQAFLRHPNRHQILGKNSLRMAYPPFFDQSHQGNSRTKTTVKSP